MKKGITIIATNAIQGSINATAGSRTAPIMQRACRRSHLSRDVQTASHFFDAYYSRETALGETALGSSKRRSRKGANFTPTILLDKRLPSNTHLSRAKGLT